MNHNCFCNCHASNEIEITILVTVAVALVKYEIITLTLILINFLSRTNIIHSFQFHSCASLTKVVNIFSPRNIYWNNKQRFDND